jgi:hypothetical protein
MNQLYLLAGTIELDQPLPQTSSNLVANIITIVLGALGGVSLIILVWAGMKYTLSSGDPAKTAEAKNQIIYAIVGIVVAMSAGAIVQFTIGSI